MASPENDAAIQGTSGGCNLLAAGKHAHEVIEGVRNRGVQIGQRMDWHGKAWITPQIVTGGFSTGNHVAGGAPKPHEAALISEHGIETNASRRGKHGLQYRWGPTPRRAINEWCLTSSAGRAWLLGLSRSGLYRVPTTEEGCLLAVVLLEEAGVVADHIVEEVSPWFHNIRFFPEPAPNPLPDGSVASVHDVGYLISKLVSLLERFEAKFVSKQSRKTAVESIYLPTYRSVVEEAQHVCAWWSDSKSAGVEDSLAPSITIRVATVRANLILFGFEKKMRRSFLWKLLDALDVVALHGSRTSRTFIVHIQRHADAASVRLARRSSTPPAPQMSPNRQVFFFQLRGLIEELRRNTFSSEGLPRDRVSDLSSKFPLFRGEIGRVVLGTLGELVEDGLLGSSEILAKQAVGVAVKHRATLFTPEPARTLALHLLTSFMARRSRLLLNLSTQVRVSEIPWFAALADAFEEHEEQEKQEVQEKQEKQEGQDDQDEQEEQEEQQHGTSENSRQTDHAGPVPGEVNAVAREIFRVHLTHFAGTQMPNRLVRLLDEYLGCKGLVKEIAADIFEGAFRCSFGAQAKQREDILGPGTAYGDYYAEVLVSFPADSASRTVNMEDLDFGPGFGLGRNSVVNNGIAVELVAVSTTHNLLHLLVALEMDQDAILLETAAAAALERLVETLRFKGSYYTTLRDRARRAAAACRAFLVFVSLLQRKKTSIRNGKEGLGVGEEEVSRSPVTRLKQKATAAEAGLPEERAGVLRDIIYAVEGRWGDTPGGQPLMGWCRSGERHRVFYVAEEG